MRGPEADFFPNTLLNNRRIMAAGVAMRSWGGFLLSGRDYTRGPIPLGLPAKPPGATVARIFQSKRFREC